MTSAVQWNALTIGSKRPMIVLGSDLLQRLGPGEQRAVIAHELGHVLSDHVLYTTALNILLAAGSGLPLGLGLPVRAVRAVLLEWVRAAELRCDRAATLAVRDPQIVCRALMVLAGGMPADRARPRRVHGPGDGVRELGRRARPRPALLQRAERDPRQRGAAGLGGHALGAERRVRPHPARRVPRRDEETDVREEAGDAFEFYAERFRAMFRELGENVTTLGDQMGNVSSQVADWLRKRGE